MQSTGQAAAAAFPPRFAQLKQDIAKSYGPEFEQRVLEAWVDIVKELEVVKNEIVETGSDYIPQISFSDLDGLGKEEIERIKRVGSVVIRDVVDDAEAVEWKKDLEEFVKANPTVEGIPAHDKQFFQLYWTKSQVRARAHPNMLKATAWLNNLYHTKDDAPIAGIDLSTPLTYADRFRIRRPGIQWSVHPPHVDGGTIERWEDPALRTCFAKILEGKWREHDPYELESRLNAKSSLYGRPNQSSVFRTFQGWLALSETAPTEGTLRVFPNVRLSNAYIILRPFVKPLVSPDSKEIYDPKNWAFDVSDPDFPGIESRDGGYSGPLPTPATHPHLYLEQTMTSVPKVFPGDTVFWHCDVVHSVEVEHKGTNDSVVMYIPAVPFTPQNQAYVERQRETFLKGQRPPDFPQGQSEAEFTGVGTASDIMNPLGRRAMGFPIEVA